MIRREKKLEKQIAMERIKILLGRAQKIRAEDYRLARRYVELARNISSKYRVRIPKELRIFCKKCLYPYCIDKVRVRVKKSRVIVTCLNCGWKRRIPIRPKRPHSK
jgi:ribonuclease P protein subunit RPR2